MNGLDTVETTYQRALVQQAALRPMTVVRIMAHAAAGQIALAYGLQEPKDALHNSGKS